jgi:hypothetical protein
MKRDFLAPQLCLTASCSSSRLLVNCFLCVGCRAAMFATKCDVQLNISASLLRLYFSGSSCRNRRISSICSGVTRGGSFTYADGRRSGGSRPSSGLVGGLSKGDAGSNVVENGVGAVGGGRWMKVRLSSSNSCTSTFVFFNGSKTRGDGLCAL